MIYEVHRKTRGNIGDFFSNPSRYFLIQPRTHKLSDDINIRNEIIIIGGGGLVHANFTPRINQLLLQGPKYIVAWGIGSNYTLDKNRGYPKWLHDAHLVGIRDYGVELPPNAEYVPCASCIHVDFGKQYEIEHKKVYYLPASQTTEEEFTKLSNKPVLTNKAKEFYRVVKFIASGETVVTNSYHGAYWAMLLGKNVQVNSWSTKFLTFKHQPVMLDSVLQETNDTMESYKNYMEDCREINKKFYGKFKNLCRL